MSNRLFQGVIHQMKDAVDRVIGVIDENGVIISCSELVRIGEVRQGIRDELSFSGESVISGGYTYRPLSGGNKTEYIVFVEGEDKMADKMSKMLAIALSNIKNLYDEKYDKGSFIKNIILDNILPSDIYIKSKELHFNTEEMRIVFLIKFYGKTDMMPFEMLQNMFPDKSKDYVISVGEHDIVLVKDIKPGTDSKEIERIATNISDTLSTEFYTKGEDSGLPNNTGAGWNVRTQADRGWFYQNFVTELLRSGNCVGWHWFTYMDNDPQNLKTDPSNRDSNKGVVAWNFEPYTVLLDEMKQLNDCTFRLIRHLDAEKAEENRKTTK